MIELLDENFNINLLDDIYGIINVPEEKFSQGLTEFVNSNMFQIKKIIEDNSITKFVAVSVHPKKNAKTNSLIKEIVKIIDFVPLDRNIKASTTGYCRTICKPVISFNDFSKNRTFFKINPHCQYLIKKINKEQSQSIIKYIKDNYLNQNIKAFLSIASLLKSNEALIIYQQTPNDICRNFFANIFANILVLITRANGMKDLYIDKNVAEEVEQFFDLIEYKIN